MTAFQRWSRFLQIDVLTINLDPGAERVHYDPEFDVRDLVSLSDVMDEYDLGPNGAQILAADLVASQAIDVFDEIEGISGDILVIDTPGQVELFAFREASSHLVEVLGQGRACLAFLFDHIAKPDFRYSHEWQVGDLLIWDNCAVQHKARFDYPPELRRRMQRCTIEGTVPY